MKRTQKNRNKKRGGAATVMPIQYYKPEVPVQSAAPGRDLLSVFPPLGVRPRIGGKRSTKRSRRRHHKTKGGFVPSVMDGFVVAAAKYITPLALFAGYKLMTRKNKRGSRRH